MNKYNYCALMSELKDIKETTEVYLDYFEDKVVDQANERITN